MEWIKKNWLWILIAVAVVIIVLAFFRPNPAAELRRQFEKERNDIQAQLERSRAREKLLRLDSIAIRKRMKVRQDSVSNLISEKDKAIAKIKKTNAKIDFSKFSNAELDSARRVILSN